MFPPLLTSVSSQQNWFHFRPPTLLFQDLNLIFSLFVVDFIHVLPFSLDFSPIYPDISLISLFISFISLL